VIGLFFIVSEDNRAIVETVIRRYRRAESEGTGGLASFFLHNLPGQQPGHGPGRGRPTAKAQRWGTISSSRFPVVARPPQDREGVEQPAGNPPRRGAAGNLELGILAHETPGAAEPQPNRYWILQEAAEQGTKKPDFPRISRIDADWLLQNLRPSAKSVVKIRGRIGSFGSKTRKQNGEGCPRIGANERESEREPKQTNRTFLTADCAESADKGRRSNKASNSWGFSWFGICGHRRHLR